jgi:hypothetical protein
MIRFAPKAKKTLNLKQFGGVRRLESAVFAGKSAKFCNIHLPRFWGCQAHAILPSQTFVNRYIQIASWLILALVFGLVQALASFSMIALHQGDLGSHDLRRILLGLALVYGGGWFIPALIVSDLALLRRTLSRNEFLRYTSLIAITALIVGLVMPGMMVMLGYPTTALTILIYGFVYRRRRGVENVGG